MEKERKEFAVSIYCVVLFSVFIFIFFYYKLVIFSCHINLFQQLWIPHKVMEVNWISERNQSLLNIRRGKLTVDEEQAINSSGVCRWVILELFLDLYVVCWQLFLTSDKLVCKNFPDVRTLMMMKRKRIALCGFSCLKFLDLFGSFYFLFFFG